MAGASLRPGAGVQTIAPHAAAVVAPRAAAPATVKAQANEPPLTGRFRRRDGVAERQLEGKCFLADNDGGTITVLNQMAAAIWRALSEPAMHDELADLAALAFPDIEPAVIKADVGSILRDFLAERLIEAG